jgi:hypothetical protein
MFLPRFHAEVDKARQYGATETSKLVSFYLNAVVSDELTLEIGSGLLFLAFHDAGEDVDDVDAILRYFTLYHQHKFHVVLSGGFYTPQQRLDYLCAHLDFLKGAVMGEEFQNVTFYADAGEIPEVVYDVFLHCAPISVATFAHAVKWIKPGGRCVFVGASAGGGYTNTINQRYTDKGMTSDKGQWDSDIEKLREKACFLIGLDADISRNVKFPNPALLPAEHPFSMESIARISPTLLKLYFKIPLTYLVSRPINPYAKRINEANSRVFVDSLDSLLSSVTEKDFGVFAEYEVACKQAGMTQDAIDPAIICFALSSVLGVKYVPGVFFIDPKDHAGRDAISCISNVEEVMPLFMSFAKCLIPAYDTAAAPLAFVSSGELIFYGLAK